MQTEAILVSGGSGGIGAATCGILARRGYRPIIGYGANREAAERVAVACGGRALALDLESDQAITAGVATLAATETIFGLVLAASPPPEVVPFGKISAEAMEHQWRVNVTGPQKLLSGVIKSCMRPRRKGIILGVLTAAMAQEGRPAASSLGAYIIAKYGLQGLLAVVAAEYPWLVVRSVRPGFTETPMLKAFDERFLDQIRAKTPFASAEDVANRIVETMLAP